MTADVKLLVELLAYSDAVWRPFRATDWLGETSAVLYEFRQRGTIPWRPSDASARGRKATERQLAELIEVKLVAASGRDRRSHIKLTDLGDRYARALADVANVDAGLATVGEVIRHGTRRVSELTLAGLPSYVNSDDCRTELSTVEALALPALTRGWLVANSDICGRVWYSATDKGKAATNEDHVAIELPAPSEAAAELYYGERTACREMLRTRKPDNGREIGFVPLSACTTAEIH